MAWDLKSAPERVELGSSVEDAAQAVPELRRVTPGREAVQVGTLVAMVVVALERPVVADARPHGPDGVEREASVHQSAVAAYRSERPLSVT